MDSPMKTVSSLRKYSYAPVGWNPFSTTKMLMLLRRNFSFYHNFANNNFIFI